MTQKIIGLSGYARTGKDTVANILSYSFDFKRIAFADSIRQALYTLNPLIAHDGGVTFLQCLLEDNDWDDLKDNKEIRRLLQRLGTEVGRDMFDENIWVHTAFKKIQASASQNIVITDVRFLNEAMALRDMGAEIWRINRPGVCAINNHKSETDLDNFNFDVVIENDCTLESLTHDVMNHIAWKVS